MKKSALFAAIFVTTAFSGVTMGQTETTRQPARTEVTQRQVKQQARIKQGVRSGALTRGETRRLERQQARIQKRKQIDKAEHGGKLTPRNKAQLNRMQNRASRHIHRAKHNVRVRK